jgi:uncharacterized protein VirK/YbjX
MPISLVPISDKSRRDRVLELALRSPRKRAIQAIKWLTHYASFRNLNRIVNSSDISALAVAYPEYRFKYLGNYLSPAFSTTQRAAILGHTYRFLAMQKILPFRTAMAGELVELWSRTVDGERYDAVLSPMREDFFLEGDLALLFRREGKPLYRLTFSFVPGTCVGLEEETALFIGGSQGYRNPVIEFRRASKLMGEICPPTLLLIILKAISKALGIRTLLGVSLAHHSCNAVSSGKIKSVMAYDAFWEANSAEKSGRFYHMTSDLAFRPSEASSSAHRARARRKQERKMELYTEMLAKCGVGRSLEFAPAKFEWEPAALVEV